jgi:hypothetical protein
MPLFTLTLGQLGPLLTCVVGVSRERQEALLSAGQPTPSPVTVQALVDTGASCTCVDPNVVQQLGIPPTGRVQVHTPSTRQATPHETNQFDVSIFIPGSTAQARPFTVPALPVIESELQHQGYSVLLGRDILSACLLVYEGQSGFFTLAF